MNEQKSDIIDVSSIEFTISELWLLNSFVRHDEDAINRKRWPVVSTELNEQITLAIIACEDSGLEEYTLLLTKGDLLLIDYHIRCDTKTPEGAKGKEILLKIYRARRGILLGPLADDTEEESYKEAMKRIGEEKAEKAKKRRKIRKEVSDANASTDDDSEPDSVAV